MRPACTFVLTSSNKKQCIKTTWKNVEYDYWARRSTEFRHTTFSKQVCMAGYIISKYLMK